MKNYLFLLLILTSSCVKVKNSENTKDYCNEIIGGDNGDSTKTYSTPRDLYISFLKNIDSIGNTTYHVTMDAPSVKDITGEGASMTFGDGSKVDRSKQMVFSLRDKVKGGYKNHAFFELSNRDVRLLINQKITNYKINVNSVSVSEGGKYQEYFKCLCGME